jgi:adenosine kinase
MKTIAITGSIAYDIMLGYDGSFADALKGADVDSLSVSFFSPRYVRHHGGTGANIAWNLKLLNQDPLLLGTAGNDGREYVGLMHDRGISTKYIEVIERDVTATAIIGTDTGERQIAFFHPGADAHGTMPDISNDKNEIAYGIVSPRNPLLMMKAAKMFTDLGIPWLFDPGQLVIGLSKDELMHSVRTSSGVIVNAYEWSLLSKKLGLSADGVLHMNPMLIVTHGESGVTIHSRDQGTIALDACKIPVAKNPTGAGDAFRAGFLTGLAEGWTLEQAGQLGNSIASFVVENEGTLLDFLDLNDVLSRAETTYGKMLPELR